jgi:hypothetical protein
MTDDELARLCDDALRRGLPASLTALIRQMLERGEHPAAVLAACHKAGATRDTFTGLAIEAEIAAVMNEINARRNRDKMSGST